MYSKLYRHTQWAYLPVQTTLSLKSNISYLWWGQTGSDKGQRCGLQTPEELQLGCTLRTLVDSSKGSPHMRPKSSNKGIA